MELQLGGQTYSLVEDPGDRYVVTGGTVAFCDRLAEDFKPIVIDAHGYGSKPQPPEFMAYRAVAGPGRRMLCLLYELYWRRQDCDWKGLNKDHAHDYEQIQVHFDMEENRLDKVVVSSVGPPECAGHGVEVYAHVDEKTWRMVDYVTSPKEAFPWGGSGGRNWFTQVREMPLGLLLFSENRPVVQVVSCYHVFSGVKIDRPREEGPELEIELRRLDTELLERWYLQHFKNRFGHDVSKPHEEPHQMYYPPPEDWISRIAYALLWAARTIRRRLGF